MTELTVDASICSPHPVNPRLYGKFCEHLGANIYHGMEAQILFNCTFGKWQFSAGDGHPDGGVREESDRDQIAQRIENRAQRSAWPSTVFSDSADPKGYLKRVRDLAPRQPGDPAGVGKRQACEGDGRTPPALAPTSPQRRA